MLKIVLTLIQDAAAAVFLIYLLSSFQSALRMAMVHDRYAHIEFNQTKWQDFGNWAPQRLRTLARLRYWAILSVPVFIIVAFLKDFLIL